MLKRLALTILLAIQVLGGGAVTLAHARDVVAAQPGVEASHTARCAILHDEVRCALGHYASARVVVQPTVHVPLPPVRGFCVTGPQAAVRIAAAFTLTLSPRAPPPVLS